MKTLLKLGRNLLRLLGVFFAALLLFGIYMHVAYSNSTFLGSSQRVYVEVIDEFVEARSFVPTVVNELQHVEIAVDVISNMDLNITVYAHFCEKILKDESLTLVNGWEGSMAQRFNLGYGTSTTIHFRVRPPDVAATSKQMFMLSVEYRPQRIEDVNDVRWKQWGVRTANSKIVEIQLQNSFLIPDSIMLASAILEFPILIFFIIPKSWKAIITRKLLR